MSKTIFYAILLTLSFNSKLMACLTTCPRGVITRTFCDITKVDTRVHHGFSINTQAFGPKKLYFNTSNLNIPKKARCTNDFKKQFKKYNTGNVNCRNTPKPGVEVDFTFKQLKNCACTRIINSCRGI